ncbi:MAG: leucine-rich repeat protein [Bacillota bacterium]
MNHRARFLTMALVVVMILLMLPAAAQAAGETGTTGIWNWKVLDDGTLSITGCTLTGEQDLVLPDFINTGSAEVPVTRIESYALKCTPSFFFPYLKIKTFDMPDSVTSIGDGAFSGCGSMTAITLSENLETIGASAFYYCSALTNVVIPNSVKSIGDDAFSYCYGLRNVILTDSHLESIGSHAFSVSGIESISLPNSVTYIGDSAFEACESLLSIVLPDNAAFTAIPDSLFANCVALDHLAIPKSVTSIGADAFNCCYALKAITVDGDNTAFSSESGVLYNADKTTLICHPSGRSDQRFDIPDSVTEIGDYAFQDSRKLDSISIPRSVTKIGKGAFFNCNNMVFEEPAIPDTVTSIGAYAFQACNRLTEVTVPEGVESIGEYTFYNCTDLSHITLPEGLESIGEGAFMGCESLGAVVIPESVESIGTSAFSFCTDLTKAVVLGASTSFGDNVFAWAAIAEDGIYGRSGSQAQTYAEAHSTPFYVVCVVSFETGEGSSTVPDIYAVQGSTISEPIEPTLPGSDFVGWYRDEACTDAWNFGSDTASGDTILYAKWTVRTVPDITTTTLPGGTVGTPYIQTLEADGDTPITWMIVSGSLPDGIDLESDGDLSGTPTTAGTYNFTVMATNAAGDDTQDLCIIINPATYTVTFESNGSVYATRTVNAGQSIGDAAWPANPTRSSYVFDGWFTGENGTGTEFIRTTPANATMTVYAKWARSGGGSPRRRSGAGTPSTPVYTADVNPGNGSDFTLKVTVDKNGGCARVDISSQSTLVSDGATSVITMPSVPDVDTYAVVIPVPSLSTPDEMGALTLNTDNGSITIPSDMLTGVLGISGSKAEISIGQGDKDNLPDDVKAAIGDRPLVQLTLSIDGKQFDWNNPDAPVTVSIPYTPTAAELANPESIVVWYIDGSGNVVTIPNGHYDPATGTVTFNTTHFSDYAMAYIKVSFNDVAADAWYSKAVSFIAAREITSGTGNGNFSPDAKLTRGEFIVLMMRSYGIAPDENPTDNFSDASDTYYTGYLAAAKRLGISAGIGNNLYAPDKEITRQEMFTLLHNALEVIGQLPDGDSGKTLSDFADAGQIDAWAKDAMTELVRTGTVGGSDGKLTPLATATRAEMAQILYNLLGN